MPIDPAASQILPNHVQSRWHAAKDSPENPSHSADERLPSPTLLAGRLHDDLSQWLVLASIRIDEAESASARSLLRVVIRESLTPIAGRNVYCVTVGPTCTDPSSTSIPKCRSVFWMIWALASFAGCLAFSVA